MSNMLLTLNAIYVMLLRIRHLVSSLMDEFIKYDQLDDGLIEQCCDIESQTSLWINDILNIKPELAQLIDYDEIIAIDFESLDFSMFGLEELPLQNEDEAEFSNFYSSSYYGFQKLKGKLMNIESSLTNKRWIKIYNYGDIIFASIDECKFLIKIIKRGL